nr:membrane protein insertase YidC [Spiroplasma helicoides]
MYKQDYSKYLNGGTKGPKSKKEVFKKIWGWTKIFLFLFIVVCMLWGCVQMYQPSYTINKVTDMAGNGVYAPGVTFELIILSLNDFGSKTHWFDDSTGVLKEYQLKSISNWAEAFTETSSPYYGFFVYPLAYLLTAFIRGFSGTTEGLLDPSKPNYGVSAIGAILFTSIIVRAITLMFTLKTQMNQEKMTSLQGKQAEIQSKYKGSKDPQTKQKQQMELMALYRKEGISPMSSIATSFLSMPFLFAMFSVVRSAHALKVATVGQITLVEQPWEQIKEGNWIYATLIAVYLPMQILSMFLPMFLRSTKDKKAIKSEQQKKARRRQIIMQVVFIVVFIFVVSTVASGVAIYWIFSSTFQISQTLVFHYMRETKGKRISKKREKIREKKLKIAEKHQNAKT